MVVTTLEEQIVQLDARVAMLEERLFRTNKPLVSYELDHEGDALNFSFSESSPAERAQDDDIEIPEDELLLLIHSASKTGLNPRLKPR